MERLGEKLKPKKIYLVYSVFFIMVFVFIFSPFLLRGNSLISKADGYNQVFPVFVYTRDYILNLFRGNVQQFDFRIGLGDDVFYSLSYYGLFDPISIICSLIFKNDSIEIAYNFTVFIKLYLSGAAFIYYAKNHIKIEKFLVCGALLYTFNLYTLFWGVYFTPSLTVNVTCPIILCGIDKLISGKEFSLSMILGLFLQGLNGFYYLYMEIIIAIIYFVIAIFFRIQDKLEQPGKIFIKKTLFFALNGILGTCLSSVVLIPSITGFISSNRLNDSNNQLSLFCGWDYFISSFGDLFIPNIYNSITTLSAIVVAGMIAGFFSVKVKKEFKVLGIGLWSLLWCPLFGSVMNGLSYNTDRWFFAVALFTIVLVMIALQEEKRISVKGKYIYIIIVTLSTYIHWYNSDRTMGIGIYLRILLFVVGAFLVLALWNNIKYRETVILIYTTMLVAAMGIFVYGPKVLGGNGYSANFQKNGIYQEITNSEKDIEGQVNFERRDYIDSSLGEALINNYYGTSEYFSIQNKNIINFYNELCISPGIRDAFHILNGIDNRKELMAMLSATQYSERRNDREEKDRIIINNDTILPLGYVYDSYVLESEFKNLNPMQKSSLLLDAVVLEKETEFIDKSNIKSDENYQIKYRILKQTKNKKRVYLELAKYVELMEQGQGEVYVNINGLHGNAELYIGNKNIILKDSLYLYYTGIEEFWVNVSEIKKDAIGYYFDIIIDGDTDFNSEKLSIYWHPINYSGIKARGESVLENVQIRTNYIKGELECRKNGVLFLSVPYSEGWKLYLNGVERKIQKANIGFLASEIVQGEYEVELRYQTPGLKCGVCISVIALFIILLLCAKEGKVKYRYEGNLYE